MPQNFLDAKTLIVDQKPSVMANLQPTDESTLEGIEHNRALFRIEAAESGLLAMNMLRSQGTKVLDYDTSLIKMELIRAIEDSPFKADISDPYKAATQYEQALEAAFPSFEQSPPARPALGAFTSRSDIQAEFNARQAMGVKSNPTEPRR